METVNAVVDKVIQVCRETNSQLLNINIQRLFSSFFNQKDILKTFLVISMGSSWELSFWVLTFVLYLMINQVITHYEGLDEYLKVVDAYVDIFLQNHMVRFNRFS